MRLGASVLGLVETLQAASNMMSHLPRRYQVDFDAYPAAATPAVYIGIGLHT
jgi:hypothetical protein